MGQTEGSSSHPHTFFFMGTLSSKGFLWALYSMGMWKIRFPIRLGKPSAWCVGLWHLWIHDSLLIHITQLQWQQETKCGFFSLNSQANNWTFFFCSSHPSVSGFDLILCCTHHESVNSAAEGVCYLPETSDLCSLSPAALHLPARCGCSFLCRHSLQYFKLICCCSRKKKTTAVLSSHVSPPWNAWNKKLQRYGETFGRFAPCIFYGRCS